MTARLRTILTAAILLPLVTLIPSPADSYSGYGDVDPDSYAAPAIAWMKGEGITTGTSTGCFSPNAEVTRAQFVVMLWRAAGEPGSGARHGFSDVTAEWQNDAVAWATRRGITTGTSPGRFSPEDPISRGDLVTMLWRSYGTPKPRASHPFTDVTADYQDEAIDWAVGRGVTAGTAPTRFSPNATADRAQTAVFLWRHHGEPKATRTGAQSCNRPAPQRAPRPVAPAATPANQGSTSQHSPSSGQSHDHSSGTTGRSAELAGVPSLTPSAPPAGYGDNLAMINANTSTRLNRLDNNSPHRNRSQAELRIGDFVAGNDGVDSGSRGIWHARCAVSHFAYDDPMVFPNQPGASHLHMFFGNTDANAYSDNTSIYNRGSSTCGRDELNRTAYWMPAVLDGHDRVIPADTITVYYAIREQSIARETESFPVGLRMLAGPGGVNGSGPSIYWQCGFFGKAFENSGSAGPESLTIPNCNKNTYSHVAANIEFPRCWDGRNLDSADHRSHMAYGTGNNSDGNRACPSSHPVELPQIKYRVMFNLQSTSAPSGDWFISSDVRANGSVGPHGASLHADWWGGWHPETNDLLVRGCINDYGSECLNDDIGDGRVVDEGQVRRLKDPGIAARDFVALCPSKAHVATINDIATCEHHGH